MLATSRAKGLFGVKGRRSLSGATVRIGEAHARDEWNSALVRAPRYDLLQSWDWGEFKRHSGGWRPARVLVWRDGEPVAGVQLLSRRVLGVQSLYAPRGPWWQDDDALTALVRWLRRSLRFNAPFLRADPLIEDASPLTRLGFRMAPRQVQPRATIVVDLARPADDIMAAFDQQVRYNARLAERKQVDVLQGGPELVDDFYSLLTATAERKGFAERDVSYFRQLVSDFGDDAPVFLARYDGKIIYGAIVVIFGATAYYLYGASGGERKVKPSELVQYRSMLWAKERGATSYDMWGIPAHPTPDNPLYGVYRFKNGFGGAVRTYCGALDLPLLPAVGRASPGLEATAIKLRSLVTGKGFRIEDHLA
jgi:lipid II:glycine glycyltransferase (peptidoglycan interpeptide bridge formation enzyme)